MFDYQFELDKMATQNQAIAISWDNFTHHFVWNP